MNLLRLVVLGTLICTASAASLPQGPHAPRHQPVFSGDPRLPDGPAYFVEPLAGDDANPGTKERPWRTIQHGMTRIGAGDTLVLRGGIYFENVTCSVVGEPDRPVTIRSFPGEQAFIDGGIPEFQKDPDAAWEPGPAPGEFVSTTAYRNIRDVLGRFEDSQIGLQTYWHHDNLISARETTAAGNSVPFYCGPGIYYDKKSGRIHARLAHTFQTAPGFVNYRGQTDPRQLPLIIAPFRSVPLFLDQAMHVRIQDLVIRGGGFNTVLMHFAVDVQFDYVTIFGGTYCIRAKNSGPVRMTNCGIIGQIPPWGYWSDNALQTYDPLYYDPFTTPPEPRSARNVARLPTHALLVAEGAEESDVFAYPFNNHWTISQCEFADAHDGIYFNGRHMALHHCLVTRIQDDGFYLSAPTPQAINDDIHIYRNYVAGSMTPFGAHTRSVSSGSILIYGNVVDMRYPTQMYRPSDKHPEGKFASGALFLAHGRNAPSGMENIGFYHNTFVVSGLHFAGSTYARTHPDSVREVLNNIFVYTEQLPVVRLAEPLDGRADLDGNLHWAPGHVPSNPEAWLASIRDSVASKTNATVWSGRPWAEHSRFGDPRFRKWTPGVHGSDDFQLSPGSIAAAMAVPIPSNPSLKDGVSGPAVGAIPAGETLRVGIDLRVTAGMMPSPVSK